MQRGSSGLTGKWAWLTPGLHRPILEPFRLDSPGAPRQLPWRRRLSVKAGVFWTGCAWRREALYSDHIPTPGQRRGQLSVSAPQDPLPGGSGGVCIFGPHPRLTCGTAGKVSVTFLIAGVPSGPSPSHAKTRSAHCAWDAAQVLSYLSWN